MREAPALRLAVALVVHGRHVNARLAPLANRGPGGVELHGDGQLAGEDVDGSQRQDAEARAVKSIRDDAEAIEGLIEGAVTAGDGHDLEAFADGLGR